MGENKNMLVAQYYGDDDEEPNESAGIAPHDRVVELLNDANTAVKGRHLLIKKVQELIVQKDPHLLDNFLDEILAFQIDPSYDVKKAVVTFIQEACKKDPELMPRVLEPIRMLFTFENTGLRKKLIQSVSVLYRVTLKWIFEARSTSKEMVVCWNYMTQAKKVVGQFLDDHNEGVRTQAIKFAETLILCLTPAPKDISSKHALLMSKEDIFSIDSLPAAPPGGHARYLSVKDLEQVGSEMMLLLLAVVSSQHVTSVSLLTTLAALTGIAKSRPSCMGQVVQVFESLHVNLPPTLADTQVKGVRKSLKLHLLSLLRHPSATDSSLHAHIATLLTDLGATHSEVMKNRPRPQPATSAPFKGSSGHRPVIVPTEPIAAGLQDGSGNGDGGDSLSSLSRKRERNEEGMDDGINKENRTGDTAKRTKFEEMQAGSKTPGLEFEEDGMTPFVSVETKAADDARRERAAPPVVEKTPVDVTMEDIIPRLSPANVADLVLLSMVVLPPTMPSVFQSTYTPIAAAGTEGQIKHLARLLAVQVTAAGLGPGVEQARAKEEQEKREKEEAEYAKIRAVPTLGGLTEGGESVDELMLPPPVPVPMAASVAVVQRRAQKAFTLAGVTKSMGLAIVESTLEKTFLRILGKEEVMITTGSRQAYIKTVTSMVTQYGGPLRPMLQEFIMSDIRKREDIALAWIYREYAVYQGFISQSDTAVVAEAAMNYEDCLTRLLAAVLEYSAGLREGLFSRILMAAPLLTPKAVLLLQQYCADPNCAYMGLSTLRDLLLKRPVHHKEFLSMLLDFTAYDVEQVRTMAIRVTKKLFELPDFSATIKEKAVLRLYNLLRPSPVDDIFPNFSKEVSFVSWNEMLIKLTIHLLFELVPQSETLIHDLASVYAASSADIKRVVLRLIEGPVRAMGMGSADLLQMVRTCPEGAETLVTRMVNVLTEKALPSPELVSIVKDLYKRRVSDVRFIIPVLTGLRKAEIIPELPKLVGLTPQVVKEVFNRILGIGISHLKSPDSGKSDKESIKPPLTPSELMIALHNLSPADVDVKLSIKATSLCLAEKSVFTQEVLAVSLQVLVEQVPLPTLFMRTVIQALSLYPRLQGFVMNILQRLIQKQVWKQKKVWEGFVRCCQRTRPDSFHVLLQLPPQQLKAVFEIAPDVRQPLIAHIHAMPPAKKAHLSSLTMLALEETFAPKEKTPPPPGFSPAAPVHFRETAGSASSTTVTRPSTTTVPQTGGAVPTGATAPPVLSGPTTTSSTTVSKQSVPPVKPAVSSSMVQLEEPSQSSSQLPAVISQKNSQKPKLSTANPHGSPASVVSEPGVSQPTGSRSSESKHVGSKPAVSNESKPVGFKPAVSKPTVSKSSVSKSSEPKPAESKPAEPKPAGAAESKPVEPKPAGAAVSKPSVSKPTESKPAISKHSVSAVSKPSVSKSSVSKPLVAGSMSAVSKPAVSKPTESGGAAVSKPSVFKAAESKPAGSMSAVAKSSVSKPTVSKPAVSKPTGSMPASSVPAVSKPVVSKPTVSKPAVSRPAVSTAESKPAVPMPADSKPAVSKPAVSKPAVSKPTVSKPTVSKPAVSKAEPKPAVPKPADSKPAVSKPAVSKPAVSKPAASKPAASKPAESNPSVSKPAESKPAVSKPTVPVVKGVPEVAKVQKAVPKPAAAANVAKKPAAAANVATKPAAAANVANKPAAAAKVATKPAAAAKVTTKPAAAAKIATKPAAAAKAVPEVAMVQKVAPKSAGEAESLGKAVTPPGKLSIRLTDCVRTDEPVNEEKVESDAAGSSSGEIEEPVSAPVKTGVKRKTGGAGPACKKGKGKKAAPTKEPAAEQQAEPAPSTRPRRSARR